jgi:hypothetical protein
MLLPLSTLLWLVIPPALILTVAILYYLRKEGRN